MNNLYLLCGKPGCGKTTLALALKEKFGMVHFSADNFMLKLFGEIEDRSVFEAKLKACKDVIYEISEQLLDSNDVVLDFGFWTKEERNHIKSLFKNRNVILVYMKLDDEKIFSQITNRNNNLKDNEYYMDRPTFDFLSGKFEEPTQDEKPIVYKDLNQLTELIKKHK